VLSITTPAVPVNNQLRRRTSAQQRSQREIIARQAQERQHIVGRCRALVRVNEMTLTVARREPQSDTPICIAMLVQSCLGRLPRRAE